MPTDLCKVCNIKNDCFVFLAALQNLTAGLIAEKQKEKL
jgi:hypothetical protein